MSQVDASKIKSLPFRNKFGRLLWGIVYLLLFRPSPRTFHAWRRMLLRLFGAKIGKGVYVYPSCIIWAPWNLTMEDHSRMGDYARCYSVGKVHIGAHSMVSQYAYLCTASHEIAKRDLPLVIMPITIEDQVWVCAEAFIAPNVHVGQGAVCAACAVVVKDVPSWTIVAGNPAKVIKERVVIS